MISVNDVMRHCRNYFEYQEIDGDFVIADGTLTNVNLGNARYFAVKGSTANNGVHEMGEILNDESFTGQVFLLAPPANFLETCAEIAAYDAKAPAGSMVSESFGNYSYNRGGASADWTGAFSTQLAKYMRPFSEVMV